MHVVAWHCTLYYITAVYLVQRNTRSSCLSRSFVTTKLVSINRDEESARTLGVLDVDE